MQTLLRRLNRHRAKQQMRQQKAQVPVIVSSNKLIPNIVATPKQQMQKPNIISPPKQQMQLRNIIAPQQPQYFNQNSMLNNAFIEQNQQQRMQPDISNHSNIVRQANIGAIKRKIRANMKMNHLQRIKTRKILKRNKDLQRFRNNIYITRHPNGDRIPITRPQAIKQLRDPDVKWQMQNWFDRLYIEKYRTNDKGKVQINPIWYDKKNKFRDWMAFHWPKRQRQQAELMQAFKKNNLKAKLIQNPIQDEILLNQSFGYVQPQFRQAPSPKQPIIQPIILPEIKNQNPKVQILAIRPDNVFKRVHQYSKDLRQKMKNQQNNKLVRKGFGLNQYNWHALQYNKYKNMMQNRFYPTYQVKLSAQYQLQCMKLPEYSYMLLLKDALKQQQEQQDKKSIQLIINGIAQRMTQQKFYSKWQKKVFDEQVITRFHNMVAYRKQYWELPSYLVGYGKTFGIGTDQQIKMQRYHYTAFIASQQFFDQQQSQTLRAMTFYAIQPLELHSSLVALQFIKLLVQYNFMLLLYNLSRTTSRYQPSQSQKQVDLTTRRQYINLKPDNVKPYTFKHLLYALSTAHVVYNLRSKSRGSDKNMLEHILAWIARWNTNQKQNTFDQIIQQMFVYCLNNIYRLTLNLEGIFYILKKCQVINY